MRFSEIQHQNDRKLPVIGDIEADNRESFCDGHWSGNPEQMGQALWFCFEEPENLSL